MLAILIGLLIMVACGENGDQEEQTSPNPQDMEEMPEPDFEDVPEIVAEVNGSEISRTEFEQTYVSQFQQMVMQAQMTGEQVDQNQLKTELVESMIDQELLIQEANNRGFAASDEEVDTMLAEIAEINGIESQEALFEAFEEQGMSREEIVEQIEMSVMLELLIEDEMGEVNISDEELQALYDEVIVQFEQTEDEEENLPTFEELRPELEAELLMQEESEVVTELIESLRAEADIVNHYS